MPGGIPLATCTLPIGVSYLLTYLLTGAVTVIEGPQGGRTCRAQLVKYDMSVLHISQTHAPRGAASALFFPCSLGRPGPTAIAYRLRALGLATF